MTDQTDAAGAGGRYVSSHPLPEGELRELLVVLSEEAAEIVVAASKAMRFGLSDGYPGTSRTNASDLAQEIGDLLEVVRRLRAYGLAHPLDVAAASERKRVKLDRFLQSPTTEARHD